MKIHSLEIENFRNIKNSGKLDFTDNLGRPQKVKLIVGPNGSGKTSILDAIQVVVRTLENSKHPELREGLDFSVQQLVRNNNSRIRPSNSKIKFTFSIEKDEAMAISELFESDERLKNDASRIKNALKNEDPPIKKATTLTWEYPKRQGEKEFAITLNPTNSSKVLGARGRLKVAVARHVVSKSMFDRIGGVCYLDQRRNLMLNKNFYKTNTRINDTPYHNDVLSWLRDFYIKSPTWNEEKSGESYWKRIQRLFNKICYPTEVIGLESDEDRDTLILKKDGIEYDLLQMSSGEHQILRILVGLVSERAKNSIVLIDEVELHLHPAWQKRLVHILRDDNESNNQYIFTTHSPFVKGLFYEDEIIDLGALE